MKLIIIFKTPENYCTRKNKIGKSRTGKSTQVSKSVPAAMSQSKVYFTLEEVAEHKTSDSLWLAIDGKVYDVTKFYNDHPGGKDPFDQNAGTDASDAFEDVGHSDEAKELMKKYYIGDLKDEDDIDPSPAHTSIKWIALIAIPVVVIGVAVLLRHLSRNK